MFTVRRTFTYALAFAGLLAALYGLSSLLAIGAGTLIGGPGALNVVSDLRSQTSLALAIMIVGAPIWLGFWSMAHRQATRSPEEQERLEHRLYLAAVFAVTSIIALFSAHDVLRFILMQPASPLQRPSTLDGIAATSHFLVYGAAWLVHARLRWHERASGADDQAHDVAVYALTSFSLGFLAIGLGQAIRQIVATIMDLGQPAQLYTVGTAADTWAAWGQISAGIIAGSVVWALIWRYDLRRGGRRQWRVAYLYAALLVAVPAALGGATDSVYEILRRVFGYSDITGTWAFLIDPLPFVLLGSAAWAYHWSIMRRQAGYDKDANAVIAAGGIPWPRRAGLAGLDLAGLAGLAAALISLLWMELDILVNNTPAMFVPDWWRDRLALSLAGALIGGAAWFRSWLILQRAAAANPTRERPATARRILLGSITLASALAGLAFTIALLWLILRAVMGDTLDASATGDALHNLSGALVGLALAAYHGVILRGDLRIRGARVTAMRVLALVEPGAQDVLDSLRRTTGLHVEVLGYLPPGVDPMSTDLAALPVQVQALAATADRDTGTGALLILREAGCSLYPYIPASVYASAQAARPVSVASSTPSTPSVSSTVAHV